MTTATAITLIGTISIAVFTTGSTMEGIMEDITVGIMAATMAGICTVGDITVAMVEDIIDK